MSLRLSIGVVLRMGFENGGKEAIPVVLCMCVLPNGYYRRGDEFLMELDIESFRVLVRCDVVDQCSDSFLVVILWLLGSKIPVRARLS